MVVLKRDPADLCLGGLTQLLVDEGYQLCFAEGADFGCCQLTVFEYHQCRNAPNAVLSRYGTVFVHVHFGNSQTSGVHRRNVIQDGGNHFARAAPFCPIVDQYRCGRFDDLSFESGIGNVFDQVAGHVKSCVAVEARVRMNV